MNNALINAQKEARKLMPALHEMCGFDFCKPYAVEEIHGRFTENKIRRMMAEIALEGELVTPTTHRIIVLMRDKSSYINADRWNLVEVLRSKVNIDIRSNYSYRDSFDYFYAKYRYEECRKSDACEAIVLAQSFKYCRIVPKTAFNEYDRVRVLDCNYVHSALNKRRISSLTVKSLEDGKKQLLYVYGVDDDNISEVIDKSGYLLYNRHRDIKNRSEIRKKEIQKALADKADFSDHLVTLANLVAYKKGILTEQFKECRTLEDYRSFEESFSYYGGFVTTISDYESYCHKVSNKLFASIEAEENAYNSLMRKLTK